MDRSLLAVGVVAAAAAAAVVVVAVPAGVPVITISLNPSLI